MPSDDVLALNPELAGAPARRSKYNAVKVQADGYTFDSKREYRHYLTLKLRLAAGEISHLEVHPAWELIVKGVLVGKYTGDFAYRQGRTYIVEDVKGVRTRDYVLRKKLMWALHKVEVKEIR